MRSIGWGGWPRVLNRDETILWRRLERLEERFLEVETYLSRLEQGLIRVDGQIRARLKEEADAARL